MSINDTTVIDSILENLALSNEYRFNAFQVAYLSKEPDIDAVNDYLLYKTHPQFGILEARVETLCPDNHPDKHYHFGEILPDFEVECRICGLSYVPDINFSHIVFYFNDKFKETVKKKAKKSITKELVVI